MSDATARSRTRRAVRNRQIAAYVAFGGITAAGVALAATSFPVLVPFYLALGGRFFGTVRAVKRVNEASVALSKGDAAAGPRARRAGDACVVGAGRVRALAELRVAIADALDGHGEQALDRVRRARAQAVAAADPAPVLVLHGDQSAHRARPHEGSAQPARVARRRCRPARCSSSRTGSRRCTSWVAEARPSRRRQPFKIRQEGSRSTRRAPRSHAQGPVDDRRAPICCCSARGATRTAASTTTRGSRSARPRSARARTGSTSRCPSSREWIEEYRKEHPDSIDPEPTSSCATCRHADQLTQPSFREHAIEHAALVERARAP